MAKILKNTTNALIEIADVGLSIPALSDFTIVPSDYVLFASSSDIVTFIGSGDIVVNDGSVNLSKAQGIALIQGNFTQTDFTSSLKTIDNRLKVQIEQESPNDFLSKISDNDQAPGFLEDKVQATPGKIQVTTVNEGAAERLNLNIGFDVFDKTIDTTTNITEGSKLFFTEERAQDAVGAILTDTSSVDLSYNDAANQITATVLPAGVDHNALQNYVANQHIDHTAVNINAGAGLVGGGNIAASRTISMPNVGTAGTFGTASQVATITTDAQGRVSSASNTLISIVASQVSNFASTVLSTVLTGFTVGTNAAIVATDTILQAFGKAQAQISALFNRNINTGTGLQGGGNLTADRTISVANTTVIAGSYGTASQVPSITVNAQGQLTAASNQSISITSSAITDFTEAAQDAVGGSLADTASIDLTYNDTANTISGVVLPAGVNHNALQNYVANEHINHANVNINAGTGLVGGGDITASRTISMPNVGTPGTFGSASEIPIITTDAQGRVSNVGLASVLANITYFGVDLRTTISTTSTAYVIATGMTITPAAGTYIVFAGANTSATSNSRRVRVALGLNGTFITGTDTLFFMRTGGGLLSASSDIGTHAIGHLVTVNGSQNINLIWNTSGGTAEMGHRYLYAIKVG